MKIKQLFLSAILAIAFVGCGSDEEGSSLEIQGARSVSVSLSGLSSDLQRASGPVGVITADTMNVNSVLVNLTDAMGTVIVSKLVTKDNVIDSDWDKLVSPSKGLKFINTAKAISKVYVYGNPGSAVNSNNVVSTNLAAQQGSGVLYYGFDDDLTPIITEPVNPDATNGQTYTANVTITPIVGRIQIPSVSFKNAGSFVYTRKVNGVTKSATVGWTGFSADLKGIYLDNVYYTYNNPGTLDGLLVNLTSVGSIQQGQWLFTPPGPSIDAASFASYNNYSGGAYVNLPLSTPNKCYAFNFFPGTEIPKIHLDLGNVVISGLTSTDVDVFNPDLVEVARFANVMKFEKNGAEMVASDFKAGALYGMNIEVIPSLDDDLKNMQYNVLVHVTIAPWANETLLPGFDLDE